MRAGDAGGGRGIRGLERDLGACEVTQFGERAGLDDLTRPDDRDPIAQLLDLREDVARQQHRGSGLPHALDLLPEHHLHERVQTAGRLIEDVQIGGHGEGGDECDLLPIPLGVGAALLARIEVEHLREAFLLGAVGGIVTPGAAEA